MRIFLCSCIRYFQIEDYFMPLEMEEGHAFLCDRPHDVPGPLAGQFGQKGHFWKLSSWTEEVPDFFFERCLMFLSFGHVISWESAEYARSLGRADEPAVVAFLHHVDDVSLAQFNLVVILGLVVVKGTVPSRYKTDVWLSWNCYICQKEECGAASHHF